MLPIDGVPPKIKSPTRGRELRRFSCAVWRYHCHSAAVTTESSISAASVMLTMRTMMVLAGVLRLDGLAIG